MINSQSPISGPADLGPVVLSLHASNVIVTALLTVLSRTLGRKPRRPGSWATVLRNNICGVVLVNVTDN
jgi:hypothetical protein